MRRLLSSFADADLKNTEYGAELARDTDRAGCEHVVGARYNAFLPAGPCKNRLDSHPNKDEINTGEVSQSLATPGQAWAAEALKAYQSVENAFARTEVLWHIRVPSRIWFTRRMEWCSPSDFPLCHKMSQL